MSTGQRVLEWEKSHAHTHVYAQMGTVSMDATTFTWVWPSSEKRPGTCALGEVSSADLHLSQGPQEWALQGAGASLGVCSFRPGRTWDFLDEATETGFIYEKMGFVKIWNCKR